MFYSSFENFLIPDRFYSFYEKSNLLTVFSGVTSPANQKLGLRMTTLHEEQLPLARKHSLDFINDENVEDEEDKVDDSEERMNESVCFRPNTSKRIQLSCPLAVTVQNQTTLANIENPRLPGGARPKNQHTLDQLERVRLASRQLNQPLHR